MIPNIASPTPASTELASSSHKGRSSAIAEQLGNWQQRGEHGGAARFPWFYRGTNADAEERPRGISGDDEPKPYLVLDTKENRQHHRDRAGDEGDVDGSLNHHGGHPGTADNVFEAEAHIFQYGVLRRSGGGTRLPDANQRDRPDQEGRHVQPQCNRRRRGDDHESARAPPVIPATLLVSSLIAFALGMASRGTSDGSSAALAGR
jgi:hypothetical protein